MVVHHAFHVSILETAAMFDPAYEQWQSGHAGGGFPQDYTVDDMFRHCLWSASAERACGVVLRSPALAEVSVETDGLRHFRFLIENAAHIYDTRARLLHCLSSPREIVLPGSYRLFNGRISIRGNKR